MFIYGYYYLVTAGATVCVKLPILYIRCKRILEIILGWDIKKLLDNFCFTNYFCIFVSNQMFSENILIKGWKKPTKKESSLFALLFNFRNLVSGYIHKSVSISY